MSILMLLAFGSKSAKKVFTATFTANGTWVCPAGVTAADISGYGARGTNAQSNRVNCYYRNQTIYATRRSDNLDDVIPGNREFFIGVIPGPAYCTPYTSTPSDTRYSQNRTCYSYDDASYTNNTPASTGASATGLGKTMPGSYTNVQQTTTSFTGVVVTPGTSYPIVVPFGGTVTISWKA